MWFPELFLLRDESETEDQRHSLTSLDTDCRQGWSGTEVPAALSCHIPAEGTRTLPRRQNQGDYLLVSDSGSEVAASSDVCLHGAWSQNQIRMDSPGNFQHSPGLRSHQISYNTETGEEALENGFIWS